MKRLLVLFLCACAVGGVLASCGGGADYDNTAAADKLTIVGAGS